MAKYIFLFGFTVLIVGLVAGYIANEWVPVPLTIIVIGGVSLFMGLFIASRGFWQRRSTQMGINALVATIALVTILGLLNFLGIRYGKTIDLTENNLYTLAPQSKELVENLEQPLTVWIFQSPPSQENERLLENYQKYSENFAFKFVDPQRELGKVQEFGVESLGEVYVEYGKKTQLVQQVNEVEIISEVKLTNAIKNIQRDRVSFVYILQGHGEPPLEAVQGGLSQAVTSLKEQGYQVQPFNFAEETSLPALANSVLVIASPQRELFPGEVDAIQTYLAEGGSLLLLLDPSSNSGLEPIFEQWGIQLDDRVIVDASGQGQVLGFNIATAFVTRYGDHPITNPFGNGISVYPLSRPIDATEKPRIEATPLAYTNEKTWAESDTSAEQVQYNPERDRAGPLVIGFAFNAMEILEESSQNTTEEAEKETSPESNSDDSSQEISEEDADNSSPNTTEAAEEETSPESNSDDSSQEISEEDADNSSPNTTEAAEEETSPESNSDDSSQEISEEEKTENDSNANKMSQLNENSRVVIFGDSDFATNGLFIQQLNGDMFLNSIDWLANRDDTSLALRPKEETNRRINLTPQQVAILSRTAMGIVPLFGLILAIISWLRRR